MSDGRVLFCRGEEDEADHDDIWDDTELIAAYDRAMDLTRTELGMNAGRATEDKSNKKWCIGDFCRAVYSEDGLTYEAEILSIGGARCSLRYVGYGNEEDQPLARLQPSAGKKARRKQEKEAESERQVAEEAEEDCEEEDEQETGNGEEEQGIDEEEVSSMGKATQHVIKKSQKSAAQQPGEDSGQRFSAAGYSQWSAGEGYPAVDQQSLRADQYAGQRYLGADPWGAGREHFGPTPGPWRPHLGPWDPKPHLWGPPCGPWGAAPPFTGPWGPSSAPPDGPRGRYGFYGPSDAGDPFSTHPAPPPPPPPPPPVPGDADPVQLANMLMSWYISGYHTGYYQASREAARASRAGRK